MPYMVGMIEPDITEVPASSYARGMPAVRSNVYVYGTIVRGARHKRPKRRQWTGAPSKGYMPRLTPQQRYTAYRRAKQRRVEARAAQWRKLFGLSNVTWTSATEATTLIEMHFFIEPTP